MADNVERIVLEVDERGAVSAVSSTNKQIAALEVQFARAGQTAEQRLLAKIATLQQRMSGDPLKLKELDSLQQKVIARMNQNVDKAGDKFAGLAGRIREGIQNPLQAAGGAVEKLLLKIGPIGAVAGAAAVAVGGLATAAFNLAKSTANLAEQQSNNAMRLGLSVRDYGLLSRAAEEAGMSGEGLTSIMRGLSQALAEGAEEGQKGKRALREIGVEAFNAYGNVRPMRELLLDIADGLGKITNPAERAEKVLALFGRGGMEYLPLFNQELRTMLTELERAGVGFDEFSANQAKKFDDAVDRMDRKIKVFKQNLGNKLVEAGMSLIPSAFDRPGHEGETARTMKEEYNAKLRTYAEAARTDYAGDPFGILAAARSGTLPHYNEKLGMRASFAIPGASEADLQAQLKASEKKNTADRAKANKDFEAEQKSLAQWEKQVAERQMGPVSRAFAKAAEFSGSLRSRAMIVALREASFELTEMEKDYQKVASAMEKASIEQWAKSGEAAIKEMEQSTSSFAKNWLANLNEIRDRARELDQRRISEGRAASTHAGRMAELATGPGGELLAIDQAYAMRVAGIQQEAAIVEQHAHLYDIDQKRWELQQDMQQAGFEYEEKVAELQRGRLDDLRRSMEDLFDAAFARSKGLLDALKGMAQAVFLTPIKQGVSSLMANALMPAMYGADGRGGIMGRISGLFSGGGGLGNVRLVNGAVPVVIQGAAVGASAGVGSMLGGVLGASSASALRGGEVLGAGRNTAGLTQLASGLWARGGADVSQVVGGPGGTSGFAGPVGGGPSGISGWAQQASGYSGWKGMLTGLGNLGRGAPNQGPMPGGGIVPSGQHGVGGAAGGAMLAGGGMLAMDGLRRGGGWGVAETTAGGALIGAKFGGPLGAVIGGAIGFAAGIGRLFVKSAAEKVVEKVKTIYGLSIDKKFAQQIVEIANQKYGKNLDMAVRSAEAKELLQLYAQTTGQKSAALMAGRVHSASLIQSRGELMQGAVYDNGQAYTYASSLRTYGGVQSDQIGTASPNAGQPSVYLDRQATMDLWRWGTNAAIAGNPRAVASSALNGSRQSSARSGFTTTTLAPGVIAQ